MMGAHGASVEDQNTVKITSEIRDALANAHEEWSVTVEEVSEQILFRAEREQFHINGSSTTAVALDHPQKPGWQVLAPGNKDARWETTYNTTIEAANTLAEITHITCKRGGLSPCYPCNTRSLGSRSRG